MTELDAVNRLLRAIGESPVNSLTSGSTDAGQALQTLQNVAHDVQMRGWYFNMEHEFPLSPDGSGHLVLPANTLAVDPDGLYRGRPYVQRGDRLYDPKRNTFVINEAITVELILKLSWDALPPAAKNYIVARAAREFQVASSAHIEPTGDVVAREMEAWQSLNDAEVEALDANVLRDSPVGLWLRRRGPSGWGH